MIPTVFRGRRRSFSAGARSVGLILLTLMLTAGVSHGLDGRGSSLRYPTRLAIDADGKVYVSDFRAGSVFILDESLTPIDELPGFDSPMAIAVDRDGRIYVGDQGSGAVRAYDRRGEYLFSLGAGNGEFTMPSDIAVLHDGRLFVADSKENCVKVYEPGGRRIFIIGGEGTEEGRFRFPSTVAVSPDSRELYVGDQGNHRIQVFDTDGNFLRSFGQYIEHGQYEGAFARIQSIALRSTGQRTEVHVVDTSQNWVQVLASDGEFIATYGNTGLGVGQLNLPLDIAVNRQGRIVACNSGNGRVEVIDEKLRRTDPWRDD